MTYILLSSAKDDQSTTRSFNEFTTRADMAKLIIGYFEDWLTLKQGMQTTDQLEYVSEDLFKFMDDFFGELCCLVKQDDQPDLYIPQATDWIKEQIFLYLRSNSDIAQQQQQQHQQQQQENVA